jgi:hypothetical protein
LEVDMAPFLPDRFAGLVGADFYASGLGVEE